MPRRSSAAITTATSSCRGSSADPTHPSSAPGSPCDIVLNAIDGAVGARGRRWPRSRRGDPGAGQQGVADHRRRPGHLARQARADRAGRLRALGAGPVPARRARRRGAQARRSRPAAARSVGGRVQSWPTVTPDEALAHPTWAMGPLVTINSSTLVNKGLEVIEAHLLFGLDFDRIEVVVHPQSVVHSMVEFYDGSTIAQASPPDMRLPIALALGWPDRVPDSAAAVRLDEGPALGVRAGRPRGVSRSRARRRGREPRRDWLRPSTTRPTRCASRRSSHAGCPTWASSTQSLRCWPATTYPRTRAGSASTAPSTRVCTPSWPPTPGLASERRAIADRAGTTAPTAGGDSRR